VNFSLLKFAEPRHFYAATAPAPGENFYAPQAPAAMASAPAHTLLYSRSKVLKGIKVDINSDILFASDPVERKLW
jgi:hypothetical protein